MNINNYIYSKIVEQVCEMSVIILILIVSEKLVLIKSAPKEKCFVYATSYTSKPSTLNLRF